VGITERRARAGGEGANIPVCRKKYRSPAGGVSG
jgi:hypothetical protein